MMPLQTYPETLSSVFVATHITQAELDTMCGLQIKQDSVWLNIHDNCLTADSITLLDWNGADKVLYVSLSTFPAGNQLYKL